MRTFNLLIVLFFIVGTALGQTDPYKMKMNGVKKVIFKIGGNDISITGSTGGEMEIQAKGYKKPPKRAEGLRPLYNTATDNTGIGLESRKEGDELYLTVASSKDDVNYTITLPKDLAISIQELNWNGGDIEITNISGEIEVKSKGSDIKMKDVSGPVVAHTISGDIEVVYSKLNAGKPNSITAVSGYVDVTLPKNTKADLILSSISGEIYTNFTLDKSAGTEGDTDDKKKDFPGHDNWNKSKIMGKINGGGTEITLKAISSDVYLRKSE